MLQDSQLVTAVVLRVLPWLFKPIFQPRFESLSFVPSGIVRVVFLCKFVQMHAKLFSPSDVHPRASMDFTPLTTLKD